MSFKPSEKEDEYFIKLDAEKRKKLREHLDKKREKERKKQEKESHWMKCPKCGSDLKEIMLLDVAIDECKGCGGIWLDRGELELLFKAEAREASRILDRLFTKK